MKTMPFLILSLSIFSACTDSEKPQVQEEVITVEVNETPTLTILEPTEDGVFFTDVPLNVSLQIGDTEDPASNLEVSIQSSIDGDILAEWQITETGLANTDIQLSAGLHNLTFTVQDTGGEAVEDSVSIEVLPPNQAPICSIISPSTDQWWELGTTVSFTAVVSDAEHQPSQLAIEWMDSNGSLGTSTPTSDGNVIFDLALNELGPQLISMHVSDPYGGLCSADVIVNVGIPPILTVRSPQTNDVVTFENNIDLWVDVEDFDTDGQLLETTVRWESDIDGLLAESQTQNGSSLYSLSTLSPGLHTITVTATDIETLSDTETLALRVNRLPEIRSLALSPDPAYTTDDLVVTALLSDPDLTSLIAFYEWYQNGQLTNVTGDTVYAADTQANDEWRVVVTPNDGYANGLSQEAIITVSNTTPSISSITLSPAGLVYNDQSVTCTAIANDPDQTVSPVYEWLINGTSYSSGTIDLANTGALPGSTVTCIVSVTDDEGATIQNSIGFVVDNRTPSVSNVSIDVLSPTTNDIVNCTSTPTDPDGESLTTDYTWLVNGSNAAVGSSLDLSTISILPTDVLTCLVTVTDPLGDNASASTDVVVQNSSPILSDVAITPAALTPVDTLTCTATGSDPDGESLTPTLEVQNQGVTVLSTSGWTTSLTPSQYGFVASDQVSCIATLTDGYGGSVQLSDSVTLDSSAPILSTISISPSLAYTGTTVTCSGNATDPNDGDITSNIQYEWMIGSSVIATGASYIVDAAQTDVNDTLLCLATIVDSHGESDTATGSLTIQNTPPTINSASFTPSTIYNDDDAICVAAANDPDDPATLSYTWLSANGVLSTTNPLDLSTTALMPNDVIECLITATDIHGGSDTTSISATVANRAPITPAPTISWVNNTSSPIAGDTLTCTATAADPDGQSVSYSYLWSSSTGTTVAGQSISSQVQGGERWTCTATASDGQLTSSSSASVNVLEPCSPDTEFTTLNLGGSNNNNAEFVRVCAGDDALGRYVITKDLLMMTTEVTQGMFIDLMGYDSTTYGSSYGAGDNHPAYYVSWHMAADFANQLTQRHNAVELDALTDCYTCSNSLMESVSCTMNSACTGYRMPTEAEWEYTARAGVSEEFWTPDGGGSPNSSACFSQIPISDGGASPSLDTFAWYCYNRYDSTYYNSDKPVGLKLPNGFGVYDMHGNISEWTTDKWGCTYPVSNIDPLCSFTGTSYTIRGGDWTGNASMIRSSIRNDLDGSTRIYKQGFRVTRDF